jgi:hypothetical protein
MPNNNIKHKLIATLLTSEKNCSAARKSLESILCHLAAHPLHLTNQTTLTYLFNLTPHLIDIPVDKLSSASQAALTRVSNIVLDRTPQANEDVSQIIIQIYACIFDIKFNPAVLRELVTIQSQSTDLPVPEEAVDSYLSQQLTALTAEQVEELTPPFVQYSYQVAMALQAANTAFQHNPSLIEAIRTTVKYVLVARASIAQEEEDARYTQIMEIIAGHLSQPVCQTGEEAHFAYLVLELSVRFSDINTDASQVLHKYEVGKQLLIILAKVLKELGIPDHWTSDVHHIREFVDTYLAEQCLERLPADTHVAGFQDKIRSAQGSLANRMRRHFGEFLHSLMFQHHLLTTQATVGASHMPLMGLLNIFGMAQAEKRALEMPIVDDGEQDEVPLLPVFIPQDNTLANWLTFFDHEVEKGSHISRAFVIRMLEAELSQESAQINYIQLYEMLRAANAGISLLGILAQRGDYEHFTACCAELTSHHVTSLDAIINIGEVLELAVLGGNYQIIEYISANSPLAFQTYLAGMDQARYAHFIRLAAESGDETMMANILALPTCDIEINSPLSAVEAIIDVDEKGNNAIMRAAMSGNVALLDLLVAKLRENRTINEIRQILNQPNQAGQTPLLLAAHYGRAQICLRLAQLGANLNYQMPDTRWGIFDIALANRQYECIYTLLVNHQFRAVFNDHCFSIIDDNPQAIIKLIQNPQEAKTAFEVLKTQSRDYRKLAHSLCAKHPQAFIALLYSLPAGITAAETLKITDANGVTLAKYIICYNPEGLLKLLNNPLPGLKTTDILSIADRSGETIAMSLLDYYLDGLIELLQNPPSGTTTAEILDLKNPISNKTFRQYIAKNHPTILNLF